MEADEEKRKEYEKKLEKIPKKMRVYLDESGIEQTICQERGWGPKGKKLPGKKSGKRSARTNILAAINQNKPMAQWTFTGNCNTEKFNYWIENYLIKVLKKGQTVIMDNVTFHKSKKTRELIESVGCHLLYLPPYSPDFNPIEKFWANMKRWIRQNIATLGNLVATLNAFFLHIIQRG